MSLWAVPYEKEIQSPQPMTKQRKDANHLPLGSFSVKPKAARVKICTSGMFSEFFMITGEGGKGYVFFNPRQAYSFAVSF